MSQMFQKKNVFDEKTFRFLSNDTGLYELGGTYPCDMCRLSMRYVPPISTHLMFSKNKGYFKVGDSNS